MTDRLESHLTRQLDSGAEFFWHRLRWLAVREALPVDRPFQLIDVGAGAGFVGQYLERDFPRGRYHFVEPLTPLESILEQRYGADRNVRDGYLCSSDNFVTLLDVVEHQPDDGAFVTSIANRMDPGAVLIATVPAFQALWSAWDVALGHHRRYTRAAFRRLLASHGFEVTACRYLFPELVLPGAWRALRERLRGRAPVEGDGSEFPDVPGWLNTLLFWGGRLSLAGSRWWPAGTSVIAVGRRLPA